MQAVVCAMLGAIITLLLGKDTNWDLLNYHLYTAHAFLNYELSSDFMGSSAQRYLNPLGFLPFYQMFQAGWHSVLIGIVIGSFHGLSLLFLWRIARNHLFADSSLPNLLSVTAIILAASSPVFLGVLGGTFLEGTTLVFMTGGLILVVDCVGSTSPTNQKKMLFAGLLFGFATGLKLTNVIFGFAAIAAFLIVVRQPQPIWKSVSYFCGGAVLATCAISGFWFIELFQEFGNPVFPLFNQIFQSPDFSTAPLSHGRFKITTIEEALTLPFRLASVHSWIYVENAAPDLRFSIIALSCCVLFAISSWRRIRAMGDAPVVLAALTERNAFDGKRQYICIAFAVMILLWQATSGNGRYALPVMVLAGPVLVLLLRLAILSDATLVKVLLVISLAQLFHVAHAGNPRWTAEEWSPKWLNVDVSPRLASKPYGFLTSGVITHSEVALYLHPNSRLSNILGVYPIDPDGPGGSRVKRFINQHLPDLRIMFETAPGAIAGGKLQYSLTKIDDRLAGWDLFVVPETCERISIPHLLQNGVELAACIVQKGNPKKDMLDQTRKKVTAVFNKVEAACPKLFSPGGGYVLPSNAQWVREYPNNDLRLYYSRGKLSYSRFEYGPFDVPLGTVEDWESGKGKVDCQIPARPFSF
jgi:hypothetical protein